MEAGAALATVAAVAAAAAAAVGLAPALRQELGFRLQRSRYLDAFGAIALVPFTAALAFPHVGRARVALDALLGLLVVGSCVVVGLALAAYGRRLALDLAAQVHSNSPP